MWRVLTCGALLVGCGGDPEPGADAATGPFRTPAFVPQLCTSGMPGEPTCPINNVALDSLGVTTSAQLQFVAQPLSQSVYIDHIQIGNVSQLHIDGLYVELGEAGGTSFSTLIADSLDVGMMVGPIALSPFTASSLLVIRIDAIH